MVSVSAGAARSLDKMGKSCAVEDTFWISIAYCDEVGMVDNKALVCRRRLRVSGSWIPLDAIFHDIRVSLNLKDKFNYLLLCVLAYHDNPCQTNGCHDTITGFCIYNWTPHFFSLFGKANNVTDKPHRRQILRQVGCHLGRTAWWWSYRVTLFGWTNKTKKSWCSVIYAKGCNTNSHADTVNSVLHRRLSTRCCFSLPSLCYLSLRPQQ